jgi:hypothetical protein
MCDVCERLARMPASAMLTIDGAVPSCVSVCRSRHVYAVTTHARLYLSAVRDAGERFGAKLPVKVCLCECDCGHTCVVLLGGAWIASKGRH